MISFNLTALTQPTFSIQRKTKTRNIFPQENFSEFTRNSFIFSNFILFSRFNSRIPSRNTALHYFKKKAMAEINTQFHLDEDQEMDTEPIYLSSDENEINSPPSSPIPQLPNNTPDKNSAITQLIAAQHERMSLSGTSAPQCPITLPTSLISDDEDTEMLTPIGGNRAQFVAYTRDRRSIPETPESPTPDNRGHADHLHPDANSQPSLIPLNNPAPPISSHSPTAYEI